MQTKVEKQPKATIKLTVTVEASKVKEAYEKVLDAAVQKTTIEGFRTGTAPKKMVEDKVGVSNLYGDVINDLLQTYYVQALKENAIIPAANPRVEIKEFDLEKDFEFTATVPLKPDVKLGDYRKALKEGYEAKLATRKKENEERLKKGEKLDDSHIHLASADVIEAVLKTSEVEVGDTFVEDEADRMLSRLVDQAQSIGLSLDQYLKSQNKTAEQLRKEYIELAGKNLRAEFALSRVVDQENVEVTDEELRNTIGAVGDEKIAESMRDPIQAAYIRLILQKNKIITKLIEEIEGDNHHDH